MVNICSEHAAANDLLFSTHVDPLKSKTVCLAFHCKNKAQLPSILLNNDPLPWKSSAKHIGCLLHEDGTMDSDIRTKRAIFINDFFSRGRVHPAPQGLYFISIHKTNGICVHTCIIISTSCHSMCASMFAPSQFVFVSLDPGRRKGGV